MISSAKCLPLLQVFLYHYILAIIYIFYSGYNTGTYVILIILLSVASIGKAQFQKILALVAARYRYCMILAWKRAHKKE